MAEGQSQKRALTDEELELIETVKIQIPALYVRRPDLRPRIHEAFFRVFTHTPRAEVEALIAQWQRAVGDLPNTDV